MKVNKNIGIVNAMIRITCGLTFLAWSTAKLSRKPRCNSYALVMLLSAMKVAEGIVRFCPVTELLKNCQWAKPQQTTSSSNNNARQFEQQNQQQTTQTGGNEIDLMDEMKKLQDQLED
ncbi:DUF2892 domain-containing protein [Heyndrickxia vini]|uniref:DUF2892 domain-containing protein n=1 Tax=Heyndrickxia vini TaxID=1476025 RepID=A0ABX7E0Q2_9BACI|nr:DUF2892 domain-containing protein [Heyndrickxia vini]QQZ09107.1 DUF2892 domain-containing protein [Heyndrickxia vini]